MTFEKLFTIPSADLATITADGTVEIAIQLASGVTAGLSAEEFVEVTLQYNEGAATTPEPSALIGLFAVGGLGLLSRKKKQK